MAISVEIRSAVLALSALVLILASLTGQCHGQLRPGFYSDTCASAENVVRETVFEFFKDDATVVAALLRLHFHDCFVNGCDASLLLDGSDSEKTAPPNLSVRGYEIIDAAKTKLEAACPKVVSCADIIAIATRDAVSFSSKGKGWYQVETGRKDGTISSAGDVKLPSPGMKVGDALDAFGRKNISPRDAVLLIGGGHSVGVAHCPLFEDRLYNFQAPGKSDPTINPILLQQLKKTCPENSGSNNNATLDQTTGSSFTLDQSIYSQLLMRKGILKIDQELAEDFKTRNDVNILAGSPESFFYSSFGRAMVNLGRLVGPSDQPLEIRKSCRAVNTKTTQNPFGSFFP